MDYHHQGGSWLKEAFSSTYQNGELADIAYDINMCDREHPWRDFVLDKDSAILMTLVARIQMINSDHGEWRRGARNVKPGELVEPDYLSEPYPVSWNQVGSEAGGRP